MRAAVLQKTGGIGNIEITEAPKPDLKVGYCLIRVLATALNHRDYWIVQGKYAKIQVPIILGSDICGIVEETADSSNKDLIKKTVVVNPSLNWGTVEAAQGSHYAILGMPEDGGLAEFVAVPVQHVFPKPDHLSIQQAAALPLAGLTAYRALFVRAKLTERDVVLITGIGGGVSSMALRMALTAGCKVFVTSGQDEKINRSQQEGALDGANYQSADWVAQLKKKSEQLGGISVVLDGAGGENIAGLIDLLKPGGRLVTYGATCGNPNSMDLRKIFWKQLTIAGSTMGSMSDFQSMMEFVSMHKITPEVDRVFTLKDTREAFERMKAGAQFGKIVVTP